MGALFAVLLLVSALLEDAYLLVKGALPPKSSKRAELPNYPDREQARQMFLDFKQMREGYVPYLVWKRLPLSTQHVNIGENGWRTHRAGTEDNAADAASIGFFGGSTMLGKGVSDDETIPAWFDRLTTGFDVTNYGQGGHTARQNLALLVNLISEEEMPEIVVFYGGYNHVWTHCNHAVTRRLNGHMAERKLERALRERPEGGYAVNELVRPLIGRLRRVLGDDRFAHDEFVCHADTERARQVAETLVGIWRMAATLVEAEGGRFHAFLQPVAHIGGPRLDHLDVKHPEARAQFAALYPLVQRRLRRFESHWFGDLTRAFDVDEYVYIDDAHVSSRGNEIIARQMLDRISDRRAAKQRTGDGRE